LFAGSPLENGTGKKLHSPRIQPVPGSVGVFNYIREKVWYALWYIKVNVDENI
jgi:hypothetical protein